jgi:hypothetical protein
VLETAAAWIARLLIDDADRCLLGGRSAAVDPRVERDEITTGVPSSVPPESRTLMVLEIRRLLPPLLSLIS